MSDVLLSGYTRIRSVMEPITLRLEENTLESLEKEAAEHDVSRSEYIRNLFQSRHESAELRRKYERLQVEHDQLREDYERVQKEYDELQSEYEGLREERERIREKYEALRDDYDRLQTEHAEEIERLEERHKEELADQQAEHEAEIEELEGEIEHLQNQVDRLQRTNLKVLEQREENTDLQVYVDERREWEQASWFTRQKWRIFGKG